MPHICGARCPVEAMISTWETKYFEANAASPAMRDGPSQAGFAPLRGRSTATFGKTPKQGRAWTAQEPCVSHDHGQCAIAARGAHGASQGSVANYRKQES